MNIIRVALETILVFVAIMFIHELGHFIFAKRAGIFVREFSIGLGPKLFSFKKGETRYSLRILPLGAYVRMAGEDPEIVEIKTGHFLGLKLDSKQVVTDIFFDKEDIEKYKKIKVEYADLEHDLIIKGTDAEDNLVKFTVSREAVMHEGKTKVQIAPWDRQFVAKSLINRFAAVFAGPVFNVFLAIILFFSLTVMIGVPSGKFEVTEVVAGSPAAEAGIVEGDIILGANNDNKLISGNELLMLIQKSADKELNLVVDRNGKQEIFKITPVLNKEVGGVQIGVRLDKAYTKVNTWESVAYSVQFTGDLTIMILDGLKQLFVGNVSLNDITGPAGIIKATSDAAKQGIASLIYWSGLLSLYLGIFNLLPIPALDGSRLLFIGFEAVRGKPVDPKKESMVHLVGFAFLMLLMIVVTVNDVSKFFQ